MKLYSWQTCPDRYRNLFPGTEHFFAKNQVILVAVLTNPTDSGTKKELLTHFKKHPSDQVLTDREVVLFWTDEA